LGFQIQLVPLHLVYAPMNPVLLVTKEDEATGMHLVMFDEEMDDATLEENMRAVEEELTEGDDELDELEFDDMGGVVCSFCMTPIGQPCTCEPMTWLYFVFVQSVFVFVGRFPRRGDDVR
jgi:hypothetical protein